MRISRFLPYQFVILVLLVLAFNCFQRELLPKASSVYSSKTLALASSIKITADKPTKQKVTECSNPITQAAMNFCSKLSAEAADKELNQVYQELRKKLRGTPPEKKLIEAQLAWIEFRDADCAFEISRFEGGSIVPLVYATCLESRTKQRIKTLENYLAYPD